jgi:hypothetical protein
MNDEDSTPPFLPPPAVKPGFDRDNVVVVTEHEYWGHISRPSKMKQPLPEGWRPARPLTPEEEQRLIDMTLWVRARGVEMNDWEAFWESWLRKHHQYREEKDGKSATAALRQLGERTGGNAADYVPGSRGPKPLELDHGNGRPRLEFLSS